MNGPRDERKREKSMVRTTWKLVSKLVMMPVLATVMVTAWLGIADAAQVNQTNFNTGADASVLSGQVEGFWTFSTDGGGRNWNYDQNTTTSGSVGPNCPYEGAAYAFTEASTGAATDEWYADSPVLDLDANSYTIDFYWDKHHNSAAVTCTLAVQLSTDGGATFPTTVWSTTQDDGLGSTAGNCNTAVDWHNQVIDLSGYSGNNAVVRIFASSGGSYQCDTAIDLITTNSTPKCSDPDPATLSTTNPSSSSTVNGTVPITATVGTESAPATMTGMVVNITGSTGCNVTNGPMTWNGSAWQYDWNTSACGTGTLDTGITIDVSGNDPDCGTAVNAAQVTNVTIDNTCIDPDPANLTITAPTTNELVGGTRTISVTVGNEGTPSAMTSMFVNIAGSSSCNVTNGVMNWNGPASAWQYSWNTSACGTVTQEFGVTIDVSGNDPDCGTVVNAGQVTVKINNGAPVVPAGNTYLLILLFIGMITVIVYMGRHQKGQAS